MNRKKRSFLLSLPLLILWAVAFLAVGYSQAQAQDKYPNRPITIIVPLSAGGGVDTLTRLTTTYLKTRWGVPINVVNKAGGNTLPASLEVFKSTPDGYTLLADANPCSSMLSVVVKDLPFKVLDRSFIGTTAFTPMLALVHAPLPYKTFNDLEVAAKKNPANFTWASGGGANTSDFMARQFFKAINVDVNKTRPVMGKGGAELVAMTAGGHVMFGSGTIVASLPTMTADLVRPLAIASETRWPDLPSIPTTAEAGYPTVNVKIWSGFSGPPQLPASVLDAWTKALQDIMKNPEYLAKLKGLGAVPFYQNPAEMKEYIRKETEEVAALWGLK